METQLTSSNNEVPSSTEDADKVLQKVLGSCNINFLFGAGVNGSAFPDFAKFKDTIKLMNKLGLNGESIESALSSNSDDGIRDKVRSAFVTEYNSHNDYKLDNESLSNLADLLLVSAEVAERVENRHPESKRLNIFTLNYDRIVEEILEDRGLFSYTVTQEIPKARLPFNVVGYNTETHAFVPTFCIYKLHGSVGTDRKLSDSNIVFPGQDKLGSIISRFYETLFAFKGELLKSNSALFVIGYSWSDSHINRIISEAMNNDLTVYWLQYSKSDKLPDDLNSAVISIPPAYDKQPLQDTTMTLATMFRKAM